MLTSLACAPNGSTQGVGFAMQMRPLPYRFGFLRDHRWVPPHASDYLDSELSPRERRRVERHTADCPECRELLRSLQALIGVLGTDRKSTRLNSSHLGIS